MSESSSLCEGENWSSSSLMGAKVLLKSESSSSENGREEAFNRLEPGKRPDTIVLRGVPANWLGGKGRAAAEGADAPVSGGLESFFESCFD